MIHKVLIAEDHESANLSLQKTLEELPIAHADCAYYCDEALTMIIRSRQLGQPYDLLITDLYFDDDGHPQKLTGGQALIAAARQAQPDLKILVFSAERKAAIVEALFNIQEIDGYVRKARNDAKELKLAIERLEQNQRYFPWWYIQLVRSKNAYEFTHYDISILSLLAQGIRQKEMPDYLKQKNIKPAGLSSIEKRLNLIREALGFSNNEQLIAYCKDMGIV